MARCDDCETVYLHRRQQETLELIAKGKTNKEIGAILGLSHRTIDKHCQAIYQELGVDNRMGAALWWWQQGRAHENTHEERS